MVDANRVKKVLLSLPEADLRVGWLEDQLGRWPAAHSARTLDQLLQESENADPAAREALITVAQLFVGARNAKLIQQMRQQAAEQHLFSLERLLRRAPPPSYPVRPPDEAPVPDYGAGRELTLGERRSLARRPDRRAFDKLLSDPHPMVIRQLLDNPKMVEDDAIRLAARRPARPELIRELARSARWLRRRRVRMAVILNPGSPPDISIVLLGLCTRGELRQVLQSTETSLVLRATARELWERRPPMPDDPGTRRTLQ